MHPSIRRVDHSAVSIRTAPRVILVSLCVLLVFLAGTLAVTHSHAGAAHANCGLCVAAHGIIHTPPAISGALFPQLTSSLLLTRTIHRPQDPVHPAAYSRPPPVDLHRS
jgi:hypothetical protein